MMYLPKVAIVMSEYARFGHCIHVILGPLAIARANGGLADSPPVAGGRKNILVAYRYLSHL